MQYASHAYIARLQSIGALSSRALAALALQALPPHGWTEERIARLHTFRADPAPLVAVAAQFLLVPHLT